MIPRYPLRNRHDYQKLRFLDKEQIRRICASFAAPGRASIMLGPNYSVRLRGRPLKIFSPKRLTTAVPQCGSIGVVHTTDLPVPHCRRHAAGPPDRRFCATKSKSDRPVAYDLFFLRSLFFSGVVAPDPCVPCVKWLAVEGDRRRGVLIFL